MRLRFTIRDLLWLAVVVALVVGWWVDHREMQRKYDAFSSIEDYGHWPILPVKPPAN